MYLFHLTNSFSLFSQIDVFDDSCRLTSVSLCLCVSLRFLMVGWNDRYIDEGNPVAGGHGDFKEDETTSLYWSAIKCEVEESAYEK